MQAVAKLVKPLVRGNAARQFSAMPTKQKLPPPPEKLKRLQEHFQLPDGKPVYLKGGASDVILYQFTMALCVAGTGYSLYMFYNMAMPKPN